MSRTEMGQPVLLCMCRLFGVFMGMVLCASSHAKDWSLSDLMHLLAQQKSGAANFVEKKYMTILDKPLESSGELSFAAPHRLEKRTLKPRSETMLLEGDELTITMPDKRPIHLRLQDHPEMATVVESIRGTLMGDRGTLEKNYTIDFSGVRNKWQLKLTPLQPAVARVVRRVHIGGTDADIKTITLDQADGDRSEMTIFKVIAP